MKYFLSTIIVCCSIIIAGCSIKTNEQFANSWKYFNIPGTYIDLPFPSVAKIETSAKEKFVHQIIIDNLDATFEWPGWVSFTFVDHNSKYPSIDKYLEGVCGNETLASAQRYKIKSDEFIGDVRVVEFEKTCLTRSPYYTEALQTRFLFWFQDELLMAYADGEAKAEDLEKFRKLIRRLRVHK